MTTELRPDLPPLPARMKRLALDHRGFPVPWFVAWFEHGKPAAHGIGEPDFRVIDTPKIGRAVRERRCWVCGDILGQHKAFVIGPMCVISRVISEPPSHRECAIFSATACPFLSRPRMRRNEKGLPERCEEPAGLHLDRNPGAACVWITKSFKPFRPQQGNDGILFQLGDPVETLWFANGRAATRDEVEHSIDTGLPNLMAAAKEEGAVAHLERYRREVMPLLPAA